MPRTIEEVENETELREPPLYRVILHNDDYTTMEFVVEVLMKIFHKNRDEAEEIMWTVHEKGKALCGVYTFEIAQTKAEQVRLLARQNSFPLLATIEVDD
ncbi:ATP-dependent Clp protease adaptor ClpS [Nitratifractor sp.]|uniref:ATP-dependent Clp protease adaptor ClpS n=1 Tax=Nitratifractor sp. TaxID=2268144 RepID=UPI0025EEE289|nr:ATP-dependent Clp protease adaptor ClpS [Nitratifractor sp.]